MSDFRGTVFNSAMLALGTTDGTWLSGAFGKQVSITPTKDVVPVEERKPGQTGNGYQVTIPGLRLVDKQGERPLTITDTSPKRGVSALRRAVTDAASNGATILLSKEIGPALAIGHAVPIADFRAQIDATTGTVTLEPLR